MAKNYCQDCGTQLPIHSKKCPVCDWDNDSEQDLWEASDETLPLDFDVDFIMGEDVEPWA